MIFCGLYNVYKKIIVYKTPPQIYFGSPRSSDSTALKVVKLKVSNVYNCNVVVLGCFGAYELFATSNEVILR